MLDVVERFKRNAVGQRCIAEDHDHLLVRAGAIATRRHAKRCRQCRASVARTKTLVRTFFPERKAHRSTGLANFVEHLPAPGQQFVNVNLMADIEDEPVLRGAENFVQRDGQLDHAEVGAEVATGFAE